MRSIIKHHSFVFLLLFATVAVIMSSCASSNATTESKKINVVATVFPLYDFARQIGGDKSEIKLLVTPGAEVHGFEPTASDMLAINKSDLFLYIGGSSENWVNSVLEATDQGKYKSLKLIDHVPTLHSGHTHDDDVCSEAETIDEHIWTSLSNAAIMVQSIAKAFSEIDPDNSEYYANNCDVLTDELNKLDEEYRQVVEGSEVKTLVFAERFPFKYLAEDYGLTYHAAFEGCSHDTEPTLKTTAALIDVINTQGLKAVCVIEYSDPSIAKAISEATSAEILTMHSCHNITNEEKANGETYCSLMRKNLDVLKKALG